MANFGDAANLAAKLIRERRLPPSDAWQRATEMTFPTSRSLQVKGCPKGAFLGLCEAGLVRGAPPGHYTRSKKNKRYALNAVRALRRTPSLLQDRRALWLAALGEESAKEHNGQMDVVVALWTTGSIVLADGV